MVLVEPTPVESLPPVEPTPEPSPQVNTNNQYETIFTMVVKIMVFCCSDIIEANLFLFSRPRSLKSRNQRRRQRSRLRMLRRSSSKSLLHHQLPKWLPWLRRRRRRWSRRQQRLLLNFQHLQLQRQSQWPSRPPPREKPRSKNLSKQHLSPYSQARPETCWQQSRRQASTTKMHRR